MSTTKEESKFKRKLTGVVVSDVNDKTIVVKVTRKIKHAKYSKFVQKSKKYHAHDEANTAKNGERVTIIESSSFSKKKKWELLG
jgi:small subunit ribosomal protein S17